MKLIIAAALAGVAFATAPAAATDLFGSAPPLSFPASETGTAVEVGSNWYIRGDIGMSVGSVPSLNLSSQTVPPAGNASTPIGVNPGASKFGKNLTADVGVGYRYNDMLRLEGTYEFRNGLGGSAQTTVICPYAANIETVTTQTANGPVQTPTGVLYNPADTCNGVLKLKQWNNMVLGNAYVDLGNYYGVTPYVGAGAGLNVNYATGALNYLETANGSPYRANLTPNGTTPYIWRYPNGTAVNPAPNIAFNGQNWDRIIKSTHYSFAFALMAGIGYQLSPSATLDIGYRFLDTGATHVILSSPSGTSLKQSNVSQEVRVGIRYAIQ